MIIELKSWICLLKILQFKKKFHWRLKYNFQILHRSFREIKAFPFRFQSQQCFKNWKWLSNFEIQVKLSIVLKKSSIISVAVSLPSSLLLKCIFTGMLHAFILCLHLFYCFWLILTGFVSLWLKGSLIKKLKGFVWFPYGFLRLNAVKL